jgi:hypothetical protein
MPPPSAELVVGQLNRQLAVLEGARAELEAGWVQGGWWTVSSSDGSLRLVTGYPTAGASPNRVEGVCLVGAVVRAGSRLGGGSGGAGSGDAASDVGRAVDAVYDALWASRGQPDVAQPAGLPSVPSPQVRQTRVRTLTQWNDRAGRTREEVLGLVDRAISGTIINLMSAPRPTPAESAGALSGVRTG